MKTIFVSGEKSSAKDSSPVVSSDRIEVVSSRVEPLFLRTGILRSLFDTKTLFILEIEVKTMTRVGLNWLGYNPIEQASLFRFLKSERRTFSALDMSVCFLRIDMYES